MCPQEAVRMARLLLPLAPTCGYLLPSCWVKPYLLGRLNNKSKTKKIIQALANCKAEWKPAT
eukprot:619422-Amphidinium_carterae.1